MAIKIIPEPDIYLTQEEMEHLRPEWEADQRYTVRPVSFETWLRSRLRSAERRSADDS